MNQQAISRAARAAALCLTGAMPAACSGGPSALPGAPANAAGMHDGIPNATSALGSAALPAPGAKSKREILYVGFQPDSGESVVLAYDLSNRKEPRAILDDLDVPAGMTTDKSGNLYVANYEGNDVTVYAPGSSRTKEILSTDLLDPVDVKVDGFGNVYVANSPPNESSFIVEYAPNASTPEFTWAIPPGTMLTGIALLDPTVQGQTSIYALGSAPPNSSSQYAGAIVSCFPGTPDCVTLGQYGISGPTTGIAVAHSPIGSKPLALLAGSQHLPGVLVYVGGKLEGLWTTTPGLPEFLTLNAAGDRVFIAVDSASAPGVEELTYPSGKHVDAFPTHGQPLGVAISPDGTLH